MEKIINYENLRNFAYSNDKLVKGDIKGIVLEFCGLGNMTMHNVDPGDAIEYAEKGIIYVVPYYNPWCWMNQQTVAYVDEIIAVICEKYHLDETVKIVSQKDVNMKGVLSEFVIELTFAAPASANPDAKKPTKKRKAKGRR